MYRPAGDRKGFAIALATAVIGRTFLNTARRFPYTFAPVLARGLGVELSTVAVLIGVSQATSLVSPALGPLGDRYGYRSVMIGGLLLLSGMIPAGFLSSVEALLLATVAASLGKTLFDPAVQAFIGERVSHARRGLAIGIGELSWSASTLLGAPFVGLLIAGYGHNTPFLVLGVAGVVMAGLLATAIPSSGERHQARRPTPVREAWKLVGAEPRAWWAFGFGFLISMANDSLFVVYGAWLEIGFGLTVAALGFATVAIGVAEAGGEGLTALFADRAGHLRATVAGTTLSAISFALLPFAAGSLKTAVMGLALVFITFEFTMVTSFTFFNDLVPMARGTLISGYFAAMGLGRLAGAMTGGWLWPAGGLAAIAAFGFATNVLALATLAPLRKRG